MKIAAILTGKKNSTFKNKNRLLIRGKPVFAYPAVTAKRSKKIQNFYVSSDSNYILNYCKKLDYRIIKRPSSLCGKNSLHRDVLLHALTQLKKNKILPDILVILLANAPIIKTKWIDACINILNKEKKTTAVVPVIQNNDFNPLRAKTINKTYIKNFIKTKKKVSSNRQDLKRSFFLCHNFWVIKTKEIFKNNGQGPWNFMGKKVKPYLIDKSIDIHDKFDYEVAKLLVHELKIKI